MAKRLTDTDLWDKAWFMALKPRLKCLVRFVWDKCDLSGVWCPNWKLAQMYIGEKVSETELLKIDDGGQFIKLETGKIFCVDFINFQNGKLSEKSPIHIKILSMLKNHNIPYPYPIHRVSGRAIVDVGVIVEEEVKVGVEVKGGDEIIYPFDSEKFKEAFGLWIKFKKQQFNFTYKQIGLQGVLNDLGELSDGDEGKAIKLIHHAIKKGWKGIYDIKNDDNGNSKIQNGGSSLLTEFAESEARRRRSA